MERAVATQCCRAGTDCSHCSQFLRFDGELGRLPGSLPLWCVAPRTMPAHPRIGEISGVRLRQLVCHRARSARSTLCLSIAPAGWFFSTVSLERCALRLVATQSRSDGNGRLPHRHFTLRTVWCGKKNKKKRDKRLAAPVVSTLRQNTQKEN